MGQQISVNIRMDSDVKKQADILFNDFGLNFTTAVNTFVRQALKEKAIPFQIRAVETMTKSQFLEEGRYAMRELQSESIEKGLDSMTLDEINGIISQSRQERREER